MELSSQMAALQASLEDRFAAIAHLHGPIEEQARLACHPHIVLHFVNRMSQAWLKGVLRRENFRGQVPCSAAGNSRRC